MKSTTYSTTWRNKWLTSEATSIRDMISSLTRAIEELEEMQKDGIEGNFDSAGDDYIDFSTQDAEKAKKYGMEEEEYYDEENEE